APGDIVLARLAFGRPVFDGDRPGGDVHEPLGLAAAGRGAGHDQELLCRARLPPTGEPPVGALQPGSEAFFQWPGPGREAAAGRRGQVVDGVRNARVGSPARSPPVRVDRQVAQRGGELVDRVGDMRQYQPGGYRFPPAYRVAGDLRRRPDLVIGRTEALPVTANARPRDPWRGPDAEERVDLPHDFLGIGHQVLIADPVAAFRLLLLHLADQ